MVLLPQERESPARRKMTTTASGGMPPAKTTLTCSAGTRRPWNAHFGTCSSIFKMGTKKIVLYYRAREGGKSATASGDRVIGSSGD